MPKSVARAATDGSFISRIVTSQDQHAMLFTSSMVCWHAEQPALNTSIFRFELIIYLLCAARVL